MNHKSLMIRQKTPVKERTLDYTENNFERKLKKKKISTQVCRNFSKNIYIYKINILIVFFLPKLKFYDNLN